ncbi:MAG TPA: hypothetical protein VMM57_11115 [Bacteroidota bacterium]|nr:hypothetical protein [Bacteroidota bacterium]
MRILLTTAAFLMVFAATAGAQGKFSGYMFGDYYYNFARDAATPSANNASTGAAPGGTAYQAFQFRRIYLAYDNDISEKFMSRFRLEADQGTDTLLASKHITTYVKDAFLQWKGIFGSSNLIFGIQPTPTFDASEAAWGYRSIEKTIMDLRGIVSSRDLGVSLKGKLTENGMFNYWVMIGNGAGTSTIESDKYKRYYAQVSVKPTSSFWAMINFDYQDRAQITDPNPPHSKVDDATSTLSGFVNYTEGKLNAGAEGFLQSTGNGYNDGTALATKTGIGLSLWGSYALEADKAVVLRYDYFDPNDDSKTAAYGDIRNYVIVGFSWKPDKNVSVIPNILYETYEKPTTATKDINASVTGRITLYYVFI